MKLTTALSVGVVMASMTASLAVAAGLTERLQTDRMTVLNVDRASGRFLCVEHRTWTPVAKESLAGVYQGDVVKVEKTSQRARLVLVRTAADELSSMER